MTRESKGLFLDGSTLSSNFENSIGLEHIDKGLNSYNELLLTLEMSLELLPDELVIGKDQVAQLFKRYFTLETNEDLCQKEIQQLNESV
jgi:hypothetical protein